MNSRGDKRAIGVNYVENYDWGGERSKYNQTGNQEESKRAIKSHKSHGLIVDRKWL